MKSYRFRYHSFTVALIVAAIISWGNVSLAVSYDANGFGDDGSYQAAVYSNGAYQISNAGQLYWFAEQVNSGSTSLNAILTDDITINSGTVTDYYSSENVNYRKWKTINNYSGTFNGNGHTISGIYFYCADSTDAGEFGTSAALFNSVSGKICNLSITNSVFRNYSNSYSAASLCQNNSGTIENCTVSNTWVTYGYGTGSGGLVSTNKSTGTIKNCTSGCRGDISGICGSNSGLIENCTNNGRVTRAGICNYNSGTIKNCSHIGELHGISSTIGGICGSNSGTIDGCVNSGLVMPSAAIAGGICGSNSGKIIRCANTADISSSYNYMGGIAGQNYGDSLGSNMVKDCYNTGNVETNGQYCGGIVGYNTALVTGCYHAKGSVRASSSSYAGTICGHNAVQTYNSSEKLIGTITYCLSYNFTPIGTSDSGAVSQSVFYSYNLYGDNPAFFLNGNTSAGTVSWHQNIDNGEPEDQYPVLDSTHGKVYRYTPSYQYSNYPPGNHQHTKTKTVSAVEPTCTAEGKTESIQCIICLEYLKEATTIPAKGHTESEWIIDVYPTTEQDGSRHTECVVCFETVRTETITQEDVHTCILAELPGTPVTCTENGSEGCWQCTECEAYYADSEGRLPLIAPVVIYAAGHTAGEWIVDREATTENEGLRHAMCTLCGEQAKTETIPKLSTVIASGRTGYIDWALDEDGRLTLDGELDMPDYTATGAPWDAYGDSIVAVQMLGSISRVGNYAFANCANLKTVQLAEGLEEIGDYAFMNCTSLKKIYIGYAFNGGISIGSHAFYNCTELQSASFPRNVVIGASAFEGCTMMTSLYINTSGELAPELTVGENAFRGVTATLYYPENTPAPDELTGHGGTITTRAESFGPCGADSAWWSFDSASGALTITGSGAPTSYYNGDRTPWAGLRNEITSIVVEMGISKLPSYTFEFLSEVESVTLPGTLDYLAFNAFNDCKKLNNLLIPAGVKTTYGYFNRCNALTDVYYLGTMEEWVLVANGTEGIEGSNPNAINLHCLILHENPQTCTEDGTCSYYTFDGSTVYPAMYDVNKNVLQALTPLPATGHSYHGDFCQWSSDLSAATVSFSCHCGNTVTTSASLTWDQSISGQLTVTAAAEMEGESFSASQQIITYVDEDRITVILPIEVSGLKIFAAEYDSLGKIMVIAEPEIDGDRFTIQYSHNDVRIFFLNSTYAPVSPLLALHMGG